MYFSPYLILSHTELLEIPQNPRLLSGILPCFLAHLHLYLVIAITYIVRFSNFYIFIHFCCEQQKKEGSKINLTSLVIKVTSK